MCPFHEGKQIDEYEFTIRQHDKSRNFMQRNVSIAEDESQPILFACQTRHISSAFVFANK